MKNKCSINTFIFLNQNIKNLILSCIVCLVTTSLLAQDIAGSKDHSLLSRYPDAKIIHYYQNEYNELKFAVAPAKEDASPTNWLPVKGEHTSIVYDIPEGITTVQIMKNYKDAIQLQGGEIVFECANGTCDGTDAWYFCSSFS